MKQDFSNQNLTDKDLSRNKDLSRANFNGAILIKTLFQKGGGVSTKEYSPGGARTTASNFITVYTLARSTFNGASVKEINFSGINLSDCDFTDAILTEINFRGAKLTRTKFVGAKITLTDFHQAYFERAVLTAEFTQLPRRMILTMRQLDMAFGLPWEFQDYLMRIGHPEFQPDYMPPAAESAKEEAPEATHAEADDTSNK